MKSRAANRYSVLVDASGPGACATAQAAAIGTDNPCVTPSSNAGHHGNSRQQGRGVPGSLAHRRVSRMRFGRRSRELPPLESANPEAEGNRDRFCPRSESLLTPGRVFTSLTEAAAVPTEYDRAET